MKFSCPQVGEGIAVMFSATVLEHFHSPYHLGPLPDANAVGQVGMPGEGPHLILHLHIEEECIQAASFETYPCPVAIGSASWLVRWVEGKTVEQAGMIEAEELMQVLGGVPLGKEHCAIRAVQALRRALEEYRSQQETGA